MFSFVSFEVPERASAKDCSIFFSGSIPSTIIEPSCSLTSPNWLLNCWNGPNPTLETASAWPLKPIDKASTALFNLSTLPTSPSITKP